MLGIVRTLHQAGHAVDVFVLNTARHHQRGSALQPYCSNVTSVDIDTSITFRGALRNLLSPLRSGRGMWRVGKRAVALSYWVERFVDSNAIAAFEKLLCTSPAYDVVMCESLFTAPYGFEALRLMDEGLCPKCPVVLRAHNIEFRIQQRMSMERSRPVFERLYRRLLARRTKTFESEVFQGFDGIAPMTDEDARIVREISPQVPMCTTPPGIELHRHDVQNLAPLPNSICLFGSMEWAPNVQGALWFAQRVMPRILAEIPDAVLHVGGRGENADVRALHNGTSVVVHGEIDDAAAFRASCIISAVPVFSGSGIRIKIQEAMSLARVVVSTTVGIEGIPATHGEHCFIADTEEEFAACCIKVLQDATLASTVGLAAHSFVTERYSWGQTISDLLPWIRSLNAREHHSSAA